VGLLRKLFEKLKAGRSMDEKGFALISSFQNNPKLKNAFKDARMMVLIISVGLAVLATLIVNLYVKAKIFQVSGGEMAMSLYAVKNISEGDVITSKDLGARETPQAYRHFQSIQAGHESIVLGQMALVDIQKNQALLWTDIYLKNMETLSQKLEPGERAITLKVDSINSVAGLVEPGDRIDVLGIFHEGTDQAGQPELITKTVLQNVTILAVGGKMVQDKLYLEKGTSKKSFFGRASSGSDDAKINTLTLKVTAEEASILAFVEEEADIRVTLRSRGDIFVETVPSVEMGDVMAFNSAFSSEVRQKKEGYPTIFEGGADKGSAYWPNRTDASFHSSEPDELKAITSIVQNELDDKKAT
jgi:pilus assembly protein CpaB